jgi:hypothetical protein
MLLPHVPHHQLPHSHPKCTHAVSSLAAPSQGGAAGGKQQSLEDVLAAANALLDNLQAGNPPSPGAMSLQGSIDELSALGYMCDESGCVLVLPGDHGSGEGVCAAVCARVAPGCVAPRQAARHACCAAELAQLAPVLAAAGVASRTHGHTSTAPSTLARVRVRCPSLSASRARRCAVTSLPFSGLLSGSSWALGLLEE